MGSFSLSNTVNNITGGLSKSYIGNGFVRNPIIAGLVVTFVTIFIIYVSKTNSLTKIFVVAALINIAYLFFHCHCIQKNITEKQSTSNLVDEYSNIKTCVGGVNDEFHPPVENIIPVPVPNKTD